MAADPQGAGVALVSIAESLVDDPLSAIAAVKEAARRPALAYSSCFKGKALSSSIFEALGLG